MADRPTIAIIGGTGALGSGLARRLAGAGYAVVIGSRTAEKAEVAADKLTVPPGARRPRGETNARAAEAAEILIVTVPFATQAQVLEEIRPRAAGKLVIDTTVPLVPPKVARAQLPPQGSAAVAAREQLGEGVRVVSAFHNVAAHKLQADAEIDCDVLVFGDDPQDRAVAIEIVAAAGLRGLHGGPLVNSAAAEALTSVLIGINRAYKVDGAGIRITGISAT
ncbi:MAG: NADPH-dependent F420 reductase [Hyphomicrobiaceae bacterium]|nr:NADPH-dependent F420 reductase [Hyphomicrobiaceae bacterium]